MTQARVTFHATFHLRYARRGSPSDLWPGWSSDCQTSCQDLRYRETLWRKLLIHPCCPANVQTTRMALITFLWTTYWVEGWHICYMHVFHPSMKVNRRPLKSSVHSICVCAKSLSVSLSILHFSDILPYLFRPIPRPVEFIYLICWLLTSSSSISYRPIRADKYSHQEGHQNKTRSYAVHPQAEKMLEQIKSGSHLTLHCLVKRITYSSTHISWLILECRFIIVPLSLDTPRLLSGRSSPHHHLWWCWGVRVNVGDTINDVAGVRIAR